MTELTNKPVPGELLLSLDENTLEVIKVVEARFVLDNNNAWRLYNHMFIYSHGMATLCATRVRVFDENEIRNNITEVCKSILLTISEEKK